MAALAITVVPFHVPRMDDTSLRTLIDDPRARAETSARAVAAACLERSVAAQSSINAFISLTPDLALADAERVDRVRAEGGRLPLDGMTVAVKDNIDVGGIRTTAASRLFEQNVAPVDAEVIRRLREAGGVVIGKAALHELIFGVTCTSDLNGPTHNPWALDRIPGGSSGGSGAALAADLCLGALGTDTGGSVRIPAALNGVTALRPSYGRVSNRGVFPSAWSFDTVGPMARSARDLAALFEVMAGYDAADPRAIPAPANPVPVSHPRGLTGLRVGLPTEFFFDGLDRDIGALVLQVADVLRDGGAQVLEVALPGAAEARDACDSMIRAEVLAVHRERYREQPELFGEGVARRLVLGESVSGVDYARALQRACEWRQQLRFLFERVDLLLTPTTAATAPTIADAETIATTRQLTRLTYPWSLAHLPALSLPCGFDSGGLPVGAQLAAAPWQDALLLRTAMAYQDVTDWHRRRPPWAPSPITAEGAVGRSGL